MLDDPGFAKIVIFALVGMVVVLTIAVIWLAVQKNTYYVDEDGDEVRPTVKKSMPNFLKKFQKNDDDDDEEMAVHAVRAMKKKPAPVNSVAKTAGAAAKTAATAAAAKTAANAAATGATTVMDLSSLSRNPGTAPQPQRPAASSPTAIGNLPTQGKHAPQPAPAKPQTTEVPKMAAAAPVNTTPAVKGVVINIRVGNVQDDRTITRFPCLIGRESGACNMVIQEPAISRRHARFILDHGRLGIEDVSEHNGTFVNGKKLPPLGKALLQNGDRVSLGRALITIKEIRY